jgi:anti-sigma B factor antagonist
VPVNIRIDDDIVVLSNFARLMNDPRHFDASRNVQDLIDQGRRKFIFELRDVGEMGASGVGLLVTLTRLVRKHQGDVVLAAPSRAMEKLLDELQMDTFWEVFDSTQAAEESFHSDRAS